MEPPVFNPGSILVNTTTNKLYGVLVATLPNHKIIVFRLDKNTHPIFSKFELHENVAKVGIINEGQYANLKSALLRHYRTTNLTPTEKKMLQPLMNFAFPLGIPEYNPSAELPERDIAAMDLNSKLGVGARLYINTPAKSCYNHLDGKICTLIDRNPQGIWVRMPSNETDMSKLANTLAFIFYKNADVPTFGGISRITPVLDNKDMGTKESYGIGTGNGECIGNGPDSGNGSGEDNTDLVRETFKKMQDADELTTTMEFNGEKLRIIPKTMQVIMPEVYSGMIYNPASDTFIAPPDVITPALAAKLGTNLILGTRGQSGVVMEMNGADNELVYGDIKKDSSSIGEMREIRLGMDGELIYEGGGGRSGQKTDEFTEELEDIDREEAAFSRSSVKNDSQSLVAGPTEDGTGNIDDMIIIDEGRESLRDIAENEEEYQELLRGASVLLERGPDRKPSEGEESDIASTTSRGDGATTGGEETDYDEETFAEILDSTEVGEGDTFERVRIIEIGELERKYPIQKGDLINYKMEQIPPLLREQQRARIIKQVNIISLLKDRITGTDDNILFQPVDYKPLVERYMRCDFAGNKFLIPLVINKKKIYLEGVGAGKHTKITKDDFDTNANEVIEGYYENIAMINTLLDKKNISINNDAYTNQIITAINPTTVGETDQLGLIFRLGAEIPSSDFKKLQADTLTVRCCDKPMKCQSYSLTAMNFDYQVNLGPIGRFINNEDAPRARSRDRTGVGNREEGEEDLLGAEQDILQDTPQFEIYYQGDLIRIIGYLRPPLDYFNSSSGLGKETTLLDSYQKAKTAGHVITVNLEDLNDEIIDEEHDLIDINQHPENFVLFMMPNDIAADWDMMRAKLDKIIPDVDAILKLYLHKPADCQLEHIYNILNKFEYDARNLNYATQDAIFTKNEDLVEHYIKFNQRMQEDLARHRRDMKAKGDKKGSGSGGDGKDDARFRYITNAIMDDIGKFYYEKYENKGISVDADDIRLRWFMKSVDNGRYFFKTLFMNYLKSYQEGAKLESLETEFALLKDKHAIFNQTRAMPGSASAVAGAAGAAGSACADKIGAGIGPNIIKYPSLGRLEQDNGKVAVDSDGNVIMVGDYALVDVEGSKQLYKRELISNLDMWIKEDLAVLYKLIQDKKNKCIANPEMKLDAANACIFDMEAIKCEPNMELDAMKQSLDMERVMADMQKQIEYIRHLPVLIAALDKEIHSERGMLLARLNNMKRYWREKEEHAKTLEEEIQKTIRRAKPCIHDKVVEYFFKIGGAGEDRYQFARPVLRNFLNVEPIFDKDFHVFHQEKREDNFTHCNICNQELICNHWRLGVSYLEDNKPIDYDTIIDIFATEIDGGYHCMACEEFIGNTAILDIDDFAKGEDGRMVRTREVMEDIALVEKQKKYIDNLITELVEEEPSMKNEDLQSKINMFQLLKRVSGLDILSMVDEVEMINFLKGYQFITKNAILNQLAQKIGRGNLPLLVKKTEQLYMIYLWCDIAARFLIILQTTQTPYELRNKSCNTNIIGFPLVDDADARAGVDFIMCILSQIGIIPDYTALADLKVEEFIKRIRKQVDEDNYIKSKIATALNMKVEEIDIIYEFDKHHTNRWKTFLPRLNHIHMNWKPEKLLNEANLKEVSAQNWARMIEVGRENGVFYSLGVIRGVNNIIEGSEKPGIVPSISSYCCPYIRTGDRDEKFNYMKYFTTRDSSIHDNLEYLQKTSNVLMRLYDIRRVGANNIFYEPLYKPSQTFFRFNLEATPDEIRDIHVKFIDTGINKGRLHVFDKYGRCIISNQFKKDIVSKNYSARDYKLIEDAITNYNTIDMTGYQALLEEITASNIEQMEMRVIDNLINELPHLDIMNYFGDFLKRIQENYGAIFPGASSTSSSISSMKKTIISGDGKGDKFSINKHLSQLNSQIAKEIEDLVSKLASNDKMTEKYNKMLSNMGNYTALYEEYKEKHGMESGIRFRYTRMEESLHAYLKFLSDVINQIKNRKLAGQVAREKIRPQFREFLPYSENGKLFKLIDNFNSIIYAFSNKLHSKNVYKVLYPEMIASMLHYMLVISLANLFDCLDTPRLRNQPARELEFNFVKRPEKDHAIIDYSNDMQIDLVNDDVQLDEDGQPIDLVDNIRMKNSNNLKTVGNFIVSYIERMSENQELYDSLTDIEVSRQVTEDKQKEIENTLRSFEWLNKENNEVNRLLIQMKMGLKKVGYGDVYKHLMNEFGRDFLDEEDDEYEGAAGIQPGDGGVEGGDEGAPTGNEYSMDRYELENELPQVIAYEDLEDGDMDYDFLAVGEDD